MQTITDYLKLYVKIFWLVFFTVVLFTTKLWAQSTCSSPAGIIVLFPNTPNCYTVSPGDTVDECFTFTAPGNILLFTSVPAGMCSSLHVSAVLYDSACNVVQPSAFGVVFVTAGSSYVWCLHYTCVGTHDTTFCPVYYDFSAIPVEWLSVAATYQVNKDVALVMWSTASESNNSHFNVEKGATGNDFINIWHVDGAGTSNQVHHYKFEEKHPDTGVTLYRIGQVDYNGRTRYSKIVSIYKPAPTTGSVYVYDVAMHYIGCMPVAEACKLHSGVYILQTPEGFKKFIVIH